MNHFTTLRLRAGLAALFLGTLTAAPEAAPLPPEALALSGPARTGSQARGLDFTYREDPRTGALTVTVGAETLEASGPGLPGPGLIRQVVRQDDSLAVRFSAGPGSPASVTWPRVRGETYLMPLGEGKRFRADDPVWIRHLAGQDGPLNDVLTMPFLAAEGKTFLLLYVFRDRWDNELAFSKEGPVAWSVTHAFGSGDSRKTWEVDLWALPKDPVAAAKRYRKFVADGGGFRTLAEKVKANPEAARLFGAAHFYLWGRIVTESDLNWAAFGRRARAGNLEGLAALWKTDPDRYAEVLGLWPALVRTGRPDSYQKQVVVAALDGWIRAAGTPEGTGAGAFDAAKADLARLLGDAAVPADRWGDGVSLPLLEAMTEAGIRKAWVGLDNWTLGLANRTFLKKADQAGWLTAPYDSYHSVQQTRDEGWLTAWFPDPAVFAAQTVTRADGKKQTGFLGRGRQVDDILSLPAVRRRVDGILADGPAFGSWFLDCDAAGEIRADFTPGHVTTQEQEWEGRRARISFLRDRRGLVVGSEQGTDYAAADIVFAHGAESPVVSWGDPDLREKKDSPFFLGRYWSPRGGVPDRFGKPVPLKASDRAVYYDPASSVPLYKLVYNDAVITSHHWENGTLKFAGQETGTMLREILYNAPPLYHLDRGLWARDGGAIVRHVREFARFQAEAVTKEMTGFRVLSSDGLVQAVRYGEDQAVAVNFGSAAASIGGLTIPGETALIWQDGEVRTYRPRR